MQISKIDRLYEEIKLVLWKTYALLKEKRVNFFTHQLILESKNQKYCDYFTPVVRDMSHSRVCNFVYQHKRML